jgi:hypothetical protein
MEQQAYPPISYVCNEGIPFRPNEWCHRAASGIFRTFTLSHADGIRMSGTAGTTLHVLGNDFEQLCITFFVWQLGAHDRVDELHAVSRLVLLGQVD